MARTCATTVEKVFERFAFAGQQAGAELVEELAVGVEHGQDIVAVVDEDGAQVWLQRSEGIIGNLGVGMSDGCQQAGFTHAARAPQQHIMRRQAQRMAATVFQQLGGLRLHPAIQGQWHG
jgi:hypothetical protein